MARWRFSWGYRSSYFQALEGDEVELSDELAEILLRDSPGVIVPADDQRDMSEPPQDRMVRRGGRRGKAISG
jgi:hypothetical protein